MNYRNYRIVGKFVNVSSPKIHFPVKYVRHIVEHENVSEWQAVEKFVNMLWDFVSVCGGTLEEAKIGILEENNFFIVWFGELDAKFKVKDIEPLFVRSGEAPRPKRSRYGRAQAARMADTSGTGQASGARGRRSHGGGTRRDEPLRASLKDIAKSNEEEND